MAHIMQQVKVRRPALSPATGNLAFSVLFLLQVFDVLLFLQLLFCADWRGHERLSLNTLHSYTFGSRLLAGVGVVALLSGIGLGFSRPAHTAGGPIPVAVAKAAADETYRHLPLASHSTQALFTQSTMEPRPGALTPRMALRKLPFPPAND